MKKESAKKETVKAEPQLSYEQVELKSIITAVACVAYNALKTEYEYRDSNEVFEGAANIILAHADDYPQQMLDYLMSMLEGEELYEIHDLVECVTECNLEAMKLFIRQYAILRFLEELDEEDDEDEYFDCDSYEENPEKKDEIVANGINCRNCKHSKGCDIYG